MYFYIIEGGTYDTYLKDIYYSEKLYSQEEFENIVKNAYKYVCEEVKSKDKHFYGCCSAFNPESICWDYEESESDFVNWIEENSDLRIINKPDASMEIGTCTTPTNDTVKLESSIDYSKVPNCKDKCHHGKYKCNEDCLFEKERIRNSLDSIKNLTLINPIEVYEFFSYEDEFADLIINSISLIKDYFPESKIYLKYNWEIRNPSLENICAYIYVDELNYERNYEIYKYKLFPEFVKLRKSYKGCSYLIDLINKEELCEILE
ncbi:MAG: hypothetical protein IKV87_07605 [Methanobrevibacter sp.]|nr:hypothetical protein [Methanobrevibacter sp.]